MMNGEKFAKLAVYGPSVVRIGVSLVFLWFGMTQLSAPASWTVLLPSWTANLPLTPETLVRLNGAFEALFGTALLVGFWVRPVALLLALHMFHVMFTVGYSSIGIRDFGLAMATTSVFLSGWDILTLDSVWASKAASSGKSSPS